MTSRDPDSGPLTLEAVVERHRERLRRYVNSDKNTANLAAGLLAYCEEGQS